MDCKDTSLPQAIHLYISHSPRIASGRRTSSFKKVLILHLSEIERPKKRSEHAPLEAFGCSVGS
jgi:hypothetical protein